MLIAYGHSSFVHWPMYTFAMTGSVAGTKFLHFWQFGMVANVAPPCNISGSSAANRPLLREGLPAAPDQVFRLQGRPRDGIPPLALADGDRLALEVLARLGPLVDLGGVRDLLPVLALRVSGHLVVRPLGGDRRAGPHAGDQLVRPDGVAAGALDLPLEVPEGEWIQVVDRLALRAFQYERRFAERTAHHSPLLDDLFLLELGDLGAAVTAQLGQDELVVRADRLEDVLDAPRRLGQPVRNTLGLDVP